MAAVVRLMLLLTLLHCYFCIHIWNGTSESVKGLYQTLSNPFGWAARWVRDNQLLRAVILIFASCVAVSADTKGVIGGRVTDPQNAAVSQATVGLTNTIDGRRLETTTNDEGLFEVRFVDVGEYTISVASTGFSVVKGRAVVTSGQRVEINIALKEIRVAEEAINVVSSLEILEPRGSSVTTGFSMTDVSHQAGTASDRVLRIARRH